MPFVTEFGLVGEGTCVFQNDGTVIIPSIVADKSHPGLFTLGKDIFLLGDWAVMSVITRPEEVLSYITFCESREEAVKIFVSMKVKALSNEHLFFLDLEAYRFEATPELPDYGNFFAAFPTFGAWGKDMGIPSQWQGNSLTYLRRIDKGEIGMTDHPASCVVVLGPGDQSIISLIVVSREAQGAVWRRIPSTRQIV